jgi:hypothetical protein
MADEPVAVERGLLTAGADAWELAVRRAAVIRPLGSRKWWLAAADAAAAELGVSRRQYLIGLGIPDEHLPDHRALGRTDLHPLNRKPDCLEEGARPSLRHRPPPDSSLAPASSAVPTTAAIPQPVTWDVITGRYHALGSRRGCVAEVFALLEPGNNSQRLL